MIESVIYKSKPCELLTTHTARLHIRPQEEEKSWNLPWFTEFYTFTSKWNAILHGHAL